METEAVVEAQIPHCSLHSWMAHRHLMESEIKLGEGLLSCVIKETSTLTDITSGKDPAVR